MTKCLTGRIYDDRVQNSVPTFVNPALMPNRTLSTWLFYDDVRSMKNTLPTHRWISALKTSVSLNRWQTRHRASMQALADISRSGYIVINNVLATRKWHCSALAIYFTQLFYSFLSMFLL